MQSAVELASGVKRSSGFVSFHEARRGLLFARVSPRLPAAAALEPHVVSKGRTNRLMLPGDVQPPGLEGIAPLEALLSPLQWSRLAAVGIASLRIDDSSDARSAFPFQLALTPYWAFDDPDQTVMLHAVLDTE